MNLKKFSLIAISITGLSLGLHAASALPNDISALVDSAAPAVVNITSKKEVKMRDNRRGFDEFERFLEFLEATLSRKSLRQERLSLMALVLFSKKVIC